jgi:4-hydroxy-2-oxoheptanedioate aldolase
MDWPNRTVDGGVTVGVGRLNKVIEKLEAGEVVASSSTIANASIEDAVTFGDSDLDMVIFEMEHYGFDFTGLRMSLQALLNRKRIAQDGLRPSIVPITRIPTTGREVTQWIIKQTLDIGVYGMIVPQIENAEEALALVNACRYPAQRGSNLGGGQRGFWPNLAVRYWGLERDEYLEKADLWPLNPDGELLVIGLIESKQGHDNLERILDATKGIGAIWPGPGDLAADLGVIGQINHPEVEALLQQALRICTERGVPCVGLGGTAEDAVRRIEQGFQIIFTRPGMASTIRAAKRPG